ncbi:Eco57I restriction-modification methylase domain-containing protein [Micromonospora chalcea]
MTLLPEWDDRLPWTRNVGGITATEILRGSEDTGLVVVAATAPTQPTKSDLQALWRVRSGGGVTPVLVAVSYSRDGQEVMALLGLTEDAVPVSPVDVALAERLIEHALTVSSPSALHAELRRRLASLAGGVASGLRNEGLFASHVLEQQADGPDWAALCRASIPLLGRRGEPLLTGLGYKLEAVPDGTILREAHGSRQCAAAVLLADGESIENPLTRFQNTNAVTHGLALARREHLAWLMVVAGSVVRLYPVDPDIGVGRKGQTHTYLELDLAMLVESRAGYLAQLLSPGAFGADGSIARLLDESSKFATGLADRLRDRIYVDVIPALAVAVANKNGVTAIKAEDQKAALDEAYHQAMIILFRLLFVAYAEDRQLLPYGVSERYTRNALKTLALDIVANPSQQFSATSTTLWDDLAQVWAVIDTGDLEGWGVPPYNGGLFTQDRHKNPSGAATYALRLTNSAIGPALRGLLVDQTVDHVVGPVDFRSLSVREFGTIYEGLLEAGLGIADTDLTLDDNETYVPAAAGDPVAVRAGEVYFHSRSGSRKATGSYFTKPFAVEHLLDHALEPSLDDHLQRIRAMLDSGKTKSAATALFDFRVTDLSMGSAHFLVAAIDRIEARFSAFLAENPLPEVAVELHTLRVAAAVRLGLEPADSGIDDAMLLRRQIARRCIYGVDINEVAVELARLGVWIHTFVPGLPLSFLNHGLIWGNSLTGVGTLAEIFDALNDAEERELPRSARTGGAISSLDLAIAEFMDRAAEVLEDLGALTEVSVDEVAVASDLQRRTDEALAPLTGLCDLITAERSTRHLRRDDPARVRLTASPGLFTALNGAGLAAAILAHPQLEQARAIAAEVQAAHLPLKFPEVFRRERPGFDTILGNPPWEKMKVEEHGWWSLRFPGIRSMSQMHKNAAIAQYRAERPDLVEQFDADYATAKAASAILAAGPYPGLRDATDVDLFAAFCWRFWHEIRTEGHLGVVLPRGALSGAATGQWRKGVLSAGSIRDLTMLVNNRKWVFDEIHPQYTIALLSAVKGGDERTVRLQGPFASLDAFQAGMRAGDAAAAVVSSATILAWSDTATLPLIPAAEIDVFAAMRAHPSLDSTVGDWQFRPIRELHTTDNKPFYDFNLTSPAETHTLPILTGGSFDIWHPDHGEPYAYADPDVVVPFLLERRRVSMRRRDTAFTGAAAESPDDAASLPMMRPRIAFRDVCRATDSRTMICALVPGAVGLVHKAPYLLRQRGDYRDEAFLLGVLSSIPFDWFARRYVEIAMTYELLNMFPVPRIDASTGRPLVVDGSARLGGSDLRPARDRIIEISGRLAAVDERYEDWAQAVGVAVGSVTSDSDKEDLVAELDALVSLLYGLTEKNLQKIFSTFHRGWDYQPRLKQVLAHYGEWQSNLAS